MRKFLMIAGLAAYAGAVQAQPAAPTAAPAVEPATCPSTGYAKPEFGVFGDNDGVGRAYELASPCNPKVVRDAAEAIGMGRYAPLGLKNVTTIRFQADAKLANGKAVEPAKVDIGVSYVIPGWRAVVDRPDAKTKDAHPVQVFAENVAWDETSPGVGGVANPKAAAERAILIKLTPFGALWSIVEAEGHVTVSTANGKTVLTGASPYDNIPVTLTLDEKNLPVQVDIRANGKRYQATFAGYTDKWEPPYLVIFPARLTWTADGKPLADMTVTGFKSNPYVVFPRPEGVGAVAGK